MNLRHVKGFIVLALCFLGIKCTQNVPKIPYNYNMTPTLFVHGHGMHPDCWKKMVTYFLNAGYPPEYLHVVTIRPNIMSNIKAATNVIAPAAELLLNHATAAAHSAGYRDRDSQRINIVSHSMGAVSSRWYAAKLQPERVHILITIAGSNHGTNRLCEFDDEAAKEMCPAFAENYEQSAVQVNLNGTSNAPIDETPYGIGIDRSGISRIPPDSARSILYFTIRIEPDMWIIPEHSATLDGAGGVHFVSPTEIPVKETSPGNYLFYGRIGIFKRKVDHTSLLRHPELLKFVAELLSL